MKKIISLILSVLLLISASSILIYADGEADAVCTVTLSDGTTTSYSKLEDALKVLRNKSKDSTYNGATLTLLKDTDCTFWWDGENTAGKDNAKNDPNKIFSSDVKFDGKGHTVTVDNKCDQGTKYFMQFSDGCEIKNLKLVCNSGGGFWFEGGACSLNNVDVTVATDAGSMGAQVLAIWSNTESFTVNGGRFEQKSSSYEVVKLKITGSAASLSIYGAAFIGGTQFSLTQLSAASTLTFDNCYFNTSFNVNAGLFKTSAVMRSSTVISKSLPTAIDMQSGVFFNTANTSVTVYGNGAGGLASELISMRDGASVRLDPTKSGIRFTSDVTEKMRSLAQTFDGKMTVEYGTLVVRKDKLSNTDFTVEAMTEKGISYVERKAVDGMEEDGSAYRAAIIGIPEDGYDTELCARSYVKLTVGDNCFYLYSDYSDADNCRSIKNVALAALADSDATYTDAEREILVRYAGTDNE